MRSGWVGDKCKKEIDGLGSGLHMIRNKEQGGCKDDSCLLNYSKQG